MMLSVEVFNEVFNGIEVFNRAEVFTVGLHFDCCSTALQTRLSRETAPSPNTSLPRNRSAPSARNRSSRSTLSATPSICPLSQAYVSKAKRFC
ncbi:hypothetical protein LOK49_LG03G02256 [Camellia lanceoleosa]|uniref:Uncharacterized protein n=1 Tax=Camellia lanceoleosa TaxID=1840588 RepID=A0ACC0I795_9ERIC|nr:hypothetical protein LOK49_LG03G02256 [Camellia lanceoleosa]